MDTILFERGSFSIRLQSEPSEQVIDLLAGTRWGTPGKLQYRQLNLRKNLPLNLNARWITTYRGDQLLGVFAILKRQIIIKNESLDAYHVRYLAASASILTGAGKDATVKKQRKSPIRDSFLKIFEDPTVIDPDRKPDAPCVFYAYVEQGNIRSMQMDADFGFVQTRTFSAITFSRFFPSLNKQVAEPDKDDFSRLEELLRQRFAGHGFFFDDHLFYKGKYLVFKDKNRIVAGVKVILQNWAIDYMPGLSGKIMLNVLPKLPILSKIMKPENFEFLLFDHIVLLPGYEHCIYPLLESALAAYKVNMGLIWADVEDPVNSLVSTGGKLGFIARIKERANAELTARYHNCDRDTIRFLEENPLFLSSFDMA